ncbi:MAG TPA: response regulator transcription factor [Anaerolineales bacterium]|nr:response regulator transcription factor [Anaerolineales bacterium]
MRILVADDHSLFRDGLVSLLEAAGFEVVGQVGDGASAVEAALRLRPDAILLDITMPGVKGLEALRQIRAAWPEAQVVILTASDDEANLFEAVEAGARGYLLKNLNADEFVDMLNGLARGEAAMTRQTTARLMARFTQHGQSHPVSPDDLTQRETTLLELMVQGRSNKEIAQTLSLSENTVKYHVKHILQKLGVQNRTEAAVQALRIGLLKSDPPT